MTATRKTLSGKRVPREFHALTWHDLVQPPAPTVRRPRTSAHSAALSALPTPESLAVTEFPETYRGGRGRRPSSVYSTGLWLRLGTAFTAAREARHPQRVAKRNAVRNAKASRSYRRAA